MAVKVLFNVLAKDLKNAIEISQFAPDRTLVGIMVKNFKTDEEVIERVAEYKKNNVLTSVGLGAGDPAMWKRVAEISVKSQPYHINQVFPAAGYTLGRLLETHQGEFLINSLIEPAHEPGMVYISTGEKSQDKKDAISALAAAKLMADIGLPSVKFYPIGGLKKIEDVKSMVKAAVECGITIFEPTGGIGMENVSDIVKACIDGGATTVIPHLYTSLVDKETGNTKPEYLKELINMKW